MFAACTVENTKLKEMLPGNALNVSLQCDRSVNSCNFQFWVAYKMSFSCKLDQCSFKRLKEQDGVVSTGYCDKVKCECIPGELLCDESGGDYVDLTELFENGVKGPGAITCREKVYPGGKYNCEFSEPIFKDLGILLGKNPNIELNCIFGECLLNRELPGFTQPQNTISLVPNFEIGGITLMVFVVGFTAIYAYLNSVQKNQRYRSGTSDGAHDEDGAFLMGNSQQRLILK